MPKISVIVPVYNVEKYIRKCMDSILAQSFTDYECIIVDDATPDNSGKICDDYAKTDTRFKVIHKPVNEGLPAARKTGFEHSCGDFIINIDSDDWVEDDMLEKLYTVAHKENADLVCCDFYQNYIDKYEYAVNIIDTNNYFNNLGFKHYSAIWTYLFSRNLYEKIKFPVYSIAEDRVVTQQALFYTKKLCKTPYPLYHYRINPESMMQSVSYKKSFEHQQNIVFVVNFLKDMLGNDFEKLESNINEYVNQFKYSIVKNKELRKNKNLYKFYSESNYKRFLLKNKIITMLPQIIKQSFKSILKIH